ncbi:MAG: hypothetical protein KAY22_23600 [Rhizorhabdus sp.]|uniref:hypothetical protein n=1 Tax=Rhizorhabdus sp. TaxID=1968843 RepID=UPI001B50A44C|nr:hypothetical protein [Rhizorhabdus sp.]MBP8235286.1 hypothetical protein [Rhizorhabdus sp.]
MALLREIASFVRWRLVPVRYATRVTGGSWARRRERFPFRTAVSDAIQQQGHHQGPTFSPDLVAAINAAYRPRASTVKPKERGAPFVNLMRPEDIDSGNPVMKLAFSPEVLDPAADYFGGTPTLDSIQVLYSWPTDGPLRESQKWHKDYGDTRSFHCIVYLNDVLKDEEGPFVYVDKRDTRRISKAPIIRRIPDDRFARELGPGTVRSFYGKAGESVFVDPAVCYHYGSRCRTPRLAIFVTFNSHVPFVPPVDLVCENRQKLLEAARTLRPDLSESFLRNLLTLPSA